MTRRKLLAGAVVLGLVTAAVIGVLSWRESRRAELAKAVELLPADTLRASWTNWSGVRSELGVELDAESDGNQAILELAGKPGKYALSALTTGPVLPETC